MDGNNHPAKTKIVNIRYLAHLAASPCPCAATVGRAGPRVGTDGAGVGSCGDAAAEAEAAVGGDSAAGSVEGAGTCTGAAVGWVTGVPGC